MNAPSLGLEAAAAVRGKRSRAARSVSTEHENRGRSADFKSFFTR
jgi:hypothetical protein